MKILTLLMTGATLWCVGSLCLAAHPRVLVTSADHALIVQKLETADWAKNGYGRLRAGIDPIVEKAKLDPEYAASRLLMNWATHYVTPLVADRQSAGGEGHAALPTPRFAGARDWATPYHSPSNFQAWRPYNDQDGKIYLLNRKTGKMEWVDPGLTGRVIETGNEQILGYAADAAFVYWLSGDETYARFAAHILTTYFDGLALTTSPKLIKPDEGLKTIIGVSSFEVIHEGIVRPAATAFDFVQPYLKANQIDTTNIENGLRRYARRITDGGFNGGNWNMNQAMLITYAALALEDDDAYADHCGRQYYIDVVLNADLPSQRGLMHVIKEGLDPQSKLWPEAAGYGFGATSQLLELSYLLSADPAGAKVLADPVLLTSVMTARQMIYPNGLSNGIGDTTNVRLNARSLELLVAHARTCGDVNLEDRATGLLAREIQNGNYDRAAGADVFALTKYVDDLKNLPATPGGAERTFWFDGLNILMQRNGDDVTHGLAAALYGTNGGHVHANGMSIELYGAGYIMGADPGRGSSYWSADHHDYFLQPLAHNTVVVNGTSSYNPSNGPERKMTLEAVEPQPATVALSPNVGFARATFQYEKPAVRQHRTLALIRTSLTGGFYFDVFRSTTTTPSDGAFHDYVYHNMGQRVSLTSGPSLAESSDLQRPGLMKAYSYLKDERSGKLTDDLHAVWELKPPTGPIASMALWMPSGPRRTVFTVNAPMNNAIRDGIAAPLRNLPMPTLIVRQTSEAWDQPFVAVYEPFTDEAGADVTSVRALQAADASGGFVATSVEGRSGHVLLLQDDSPRTRKVQDVEFNGTFGVVIGGTTETKEVYLGSGRFIAAGGVSLKSTTNEPIAADARRDGDAWIVGANAAAEVTLPFAAQSDARLLGDDGQPVTKATWHASAGAPNAAVTFVLPPGPARRFRVTP